MNIKEELSELNQWYQNYKNKTWGLGFIYSSLMDQLESFFANNIVKNFIQNSQPEETLSYDGIRPLIQLLSSREYNNFSKLPGSHAFNPHSSMFKLCFLHQNNYLDVSTFNNFCETEQEETHGIIYQITILEKYTDKDTIKSTLLPRLLKPKFGIIICVYMQQFSEIFARSYPDHKLVDFILDILSRTANYHNINYLQQAGSDTCTKILGLLLEEQHNLNYIKSLMEKRSIWCDEAYDAMLRLKDKKIALSQENLDILFARSAEFMTISDLIKNNDIQFLYSWITAVVRSPIRPLASITESLHEILKLERYQNTQNFHDLDIILGSTYPVAILQRLADRRIHDNLRGNESLGSAYHQLLLLNINIPIAHVETIISYQIDLSVVASLYAKYANNNILDLLEQLFAKNLYTYSVLNILCNIHLQLNSELSNALCALISNKYINEHNIIQLLSNSDLNTIQYFKKIYEVVSLSLLFTQQDHEILYEKMQLISDTSLKNISICVGDHHKQLMNILRTSDKKDEIEQFCQPLIDLNITFDSVVSEIVINFVVTELDACADRLRPLYLRPEISIGVPQLFGCQSSTNHIEPIMPEFVDVYRRWQLSRISFKPSTIPEDLSKFLSEQEQTLSGDKINIYYLEVLKRCNPVDPNKPKLELPPLMNFFHTLYNVFEQNIQNIQLHKEIFYQREKEIEYALQMFQEYLSTLDKNNLKDAFNQFLAMLQTHPTMHATDLAYNIIYQHQVLNRVEIEIPIDEKHGILSHNTELERLTHDCHPSSLDQQTTSNHFLSIYQFMQQHKLTNTQQILFPSVNQLHQILAAQKSIFEDEEYSDQQLSFWVAQEMLSILGSGAFRAWCKGTDLSLWTKNKVEILEQKNIALLILLQQKNLLTIGIFNYLLTLPEEKSAILLDSKNEFIKQNFYVSATTLHQLLEILDPEYRYTLTV